MTFWLEAQLDPELAAWLGATFKVIAVTLREIGLQGAKDKELFFAARRFEKIAILTKDDDFVHLVSLYGQPPQIVCLRFGNMRTVKIRSLLSMAFNEALRHLENGCALVEIIDSGKCIAS